MLNCSNQHSRSFFNFLFFFQINNIKTIFSLIRDAIRQPNTHLPFFFHVQNSDRSKDQADLFLRRGGQWIKYGLFFVHIFSRVHHGSHKTRSLRGNKKHYKLARHDIKFFSYATPREMAPAGTFLVDSPLLFRFYCTRNSDLFYRTK